MSTLYSKTDNYALNLYGDDDPADLRDGYNGSMRTIDDNLNKHLDRIEAVEAHETHDEEVVKTLLGDNTVDNATTAKIKWDTAAADATDAKGKATSNMAILNALGASDVANAAAIRQLVVNATPRQHTCVMFGDSWTQFSNAKVFHRINELNTPYHVVANYGVGGQKIQELTSQAETARADKNVDPSTVDEVIIIMGVNNVFFNLTLNDADAAFAFGKIRNLYPHANIHFFPNKSRTNDSFRTSLYTYMFWGAERAGITVHPEFLYLPMEDNFKLYMGTDETGVIHLNESGYAKLAEWIVQVLQHGRVAGSATFTIPFKTTKKSEEKKGFYQFDVRIHINSDGMNINGGFGNGQLKDEGTSISDYENVVSNIKSLAPTGDDNAVNTVPFPFYVPFRCNLQAKGAIVPMEAKANSSDLTPLWDDVVGTLPTSSRDTFYRYSFCETLPFTW